VVWPFAFLLVCFRLCMDCNRSNEDISAQLAKVFVFLTGTGSERLPSFLNSIKANLWP
jgi:hypothetical protein